MRDPMLIVRCDNVTPTEVMAPRSLVERDEFGPLNGPGDLLRAPLVPAALLLREDLGHALCAWLPREHLL